MDVFQFNFPLGNVWSSFFNFEKHFTARYLRLLAKAKEGQEKASGVGRLEMVPVTGCSHVTVQEGQEMNKVVPSKRVLLCHVVSCRGSGAIHQLQPLP